MKAWLVIELACHMTNILHRDLFAMNRNQLWSGLLFPDNLKKVFQNDFKMKDEAHEQVLQIDIFFMSVVKATIHYATFLHAIIVTRL